MSLLLLFSIILFLLLIPIFIFIIKNRKKPLNKRKKLKIILNKILKEKDFRHKIMDLDKLLDNILWELWFFWTMWEKMKKYWKNFLNENEAWFAHKIRNKFAHEIDFKISEKEAEKVIFIFKKEILNILK